MSNNTSSDQQYSISNMRNIPNSSTQNDLPATTTSASSPPSPRRFIYTQKDMQQFMTSPTRRELLSFITALGRSTITSSYTYDPLPLPPPTTTIESSSSSSITTSSSPSSVPPQSSAMLKGLSPGMASLHGSLRCMAEKWIGELPPDKTAKARFGNPMFKVWHSRLSGGTDGNGGGDEKEEKESGGRSRQIVHTMMKCHVQYTIPMIAKRKARTSTNDDDDDDAWDLSILKQCSEAGYHAASTTTSSSNNDSTSSTTDTHNFYTTPGNNTSTTTTSQHDKVLNELQSYLNLSFGHPIRIDYGTGHESSFLVFLYSLCKVGFFGNDKSNNDNTNTISPDTMAPIALSIFSQYLEVCRGLQTEYMLEPAGSHGVWGLDDYHCIPFYVGACQLQNPRFTNINTNTVATTTRGGMKGEGYKPSDIHDDRQLASDVCQGLMYFQCIRYIKSIKRGVPFFESSPMLDDISHLGNWGKVSTGLLRLYEGEVLDKMPVVQHFVFGDIFKATWTPSEGPRKAPTRTFINGVPTTRLGTDRLHQPSNNRGAITTPVSNTTMPQPSTRAPWAK